MASREKMGRGQAGRSEQALGPDAVAMAIPDEIAAAAPESPYFFDPDSRRPSRVSGRKLRSLASAPA
jgi:hypothetical protein